MTQEHNISQSPDLTISGDDIYPEPNQFSELGDSETVQVRIDKIAERQRQITAQIQVPQPVEQVWKVLTDYEALSDFIPNLTKSSLLEHPTGGIRLEQIGSQRLLKFNFRARVVLDVEEVFPKEISFRMVEGDFKNFSGKWSLEQHFQSDVMLTNLSYTVNVWPKRTMPVAIVEHRLSKDIQLNLLAICKRVEDLAAKKL